MFGYLWFMLSPDQELLSLQFSWYSAKAALGRINSLLELEEDHTAGSALKNPLTDSDTLSVYVEGVTLAYNQENQVFSSLSFCQSSDLQILVASF